MDFITNLLKDYPDIVSVVAIPVIIPILAFVFPLIIQTIDRIDKKFGANILVTTFQREPIYISFWIVLIISILSYILWYLKLPRLFDFGIFNIVIDNSALGLIVISTTSLVIITLFLYRLILIYYQPEKLMRRLERKYKNSIRID